MATIYTDAGEAFTVTRLQAAAGAPTYFVGIGTGATAAAKTSTTLSTEVETRGAGTPTVQTNGSTGNMLRVVGTQTATQARSVTNGGLLSASSGGDLIVMADSLAVSLANGDSIQQTFELTFA